MKKLKRKFRKCSKCRKRRRALYHCWCNKCINLKMKKHYASAKKSVFEHYGTRDKNGDFYCACCGETGQKFLTIDHVNNDTPEMLRKISLDEYISQNSKNPYRNYRSGSHFWVWLVRNNFPTYIHLQVLCMNCNWGKRMNNGICPHKTQLKTHI